MSCAPVFSIEQFGDICQHFVFPSIPWLFGGLSFSESFFQNSFSGFWFRTPFGPNTSSISSYLNYLKSRTSNRTLNSSTTLVLNVVMIQDLLSADW
jgi:hypothetical protein